MKKIIVKAEVRDVDKLENRLMNLGYDFDPMYWQHSRIFVPRNYEEHNNFVKFEAVLENESEAEEIRNRIEVLMLDLNILPDLVVKDTYGETAK